SGALRPGARRVSGTGRRGRALLRSRRDARQIDDEAGPAAVRALDGDRAAEEVEQLAGDRESEAGAAILTRVGLIDLADILEDRLEVLRPDLHAGVLHGHAHPLADVPDRPGDVALVRELDSVRDQVEQHLPELSAI